MFVIGAPVPKDSVYASYVGGYKTEFGVFDQRREAAEALAGGIEVETAHQSRLLFTAHWGDDTKQLQKVAYNLYDLRKAIEPDEPVAVVRKGTTKDVASEEDYVDAETVVDFGVVAEPAIDHAFGGNPKPEGRSLSANWIGKQIDPPFIIFGSRLILAQHTRVSLDVLGDVSVNPTDASSSQLVEIYRGANSLAPSMETYQANRQTQACEVHIGEHALMLAEAMMGKTAADELSKWNQVTPIL